MNGKLESAESKVHLAHEPTEPTKYIIEACPFCGCRPALRKGKFVQKPLERYIIGCINEECEIWVRTKFVPTLEEAIMAWNKRVSIAPPAAPVV